MKTFQIAGLTALTLLGSLATSQAQATTDPVGYTTVTCLANSDTIVSVPFLNTTDSLTSTVAGPITPAGTIPDNTATFTMAGVTGITANQYQTLYYVRFTSGTLDGNVYQISSNAATAGASTDVTINLNGDDAADIAVSDKFKVFKFATLAGLFPQATQTTIVESSGNLTFQRRTEVLTPDTSGSGINLAPTSNYYITPSGWVKSSDLSNANNTILWPDQYFVIRHPSSVVSNTTFSATGTVDNLTTFTIPLSTRTSGQQDNFIAIPRPVDVPLSQLGLTNNSAFVSSAGNLTFQRRDELLVFDNNSASINKAPSSNYFHNGTNWVNSSTLANADAEVIKASQGIIVRKYQTNDGSTSFWKNTPSY